MNEKEKINFKPLYEFTLFSDQEVEESVTRQDGEKTITETVKVIKKVPTYFAFKIPSRSERENAEIERASWWSKYVEKGILPEALLLKTYANYGGILSEEQKKQYNQMQVDLLLNLENLKFARVQEPENTEKINMLAHKIVELRNDITLFQQEQSVFFENTAEAKARGKMVEYLLLHMSYHKNDKDGNWEPFFLGKTTEDKYNYIEELENIADPIYHQARDKFLFCASLFISFNGNVTREQVDEYYSQMK